MLTEIMQAGITASVSGSRHPEFIKLNKQLVTREEFNMS